MARVYLAASWRNPYHTDYLAAICAHGHQVYNFKEPNHPVKGAPGFSWDQIDPIWKHWTAAEYLRALSTPIAARGFVIDLRGMEWADTCVMLLPSGRSAHLEAGWFAGKGKRVIIVTQDGEEPELMALLANHIVTSVKEVLDILDGVK